MNMRTMSSVHLNSYDMHKAVPAIRASVTKRCPTASVSLLPQKPGTLAASHCHCPARLIYASTSDFHGLGMAADRGPLARTPGLRHLLTRFGLGLGRTRSQGCVCSSSRNLSTSVCHAQAPVLPLQPIPPCIVLTRRYTTIVLDLFSSLHDARWTCGH